MEALTELCDLIAQNPNQFSEKIAWICNRCPQPESLRSRSPNPTRSQLNAVLITARFVSKCSYSSSFNDPRPRTLVLEFIRSIPASFDQSFWPKSFGISSFYSEFFGYVCKGSELCLEFQSDVAMVMGDVVISAFNYVNAVNSVTDVAICKSFLNAVCEDFPGVVESDGNKLVSCLLDGIAIEIGRGLEISSPKGIMIASNNSSTQSSPISMKNVDGASSSENGGVVANGGGVSYFEDELVENLEKQEIAFKLIGHVLEKTKIELKLMERVDVITKDQLKSISAFLKIRKRDWREQGSLLKTRISTKLSVYKAAVRLKVASLACLDSDGKSSKEVLYKALALLVEASVACVYSVWRKLRICEDLFGSLLDGISKIAVTRGGDLLPVLFIRFKRLVLATCAQADTWASSQGAMFDSVLKASCEIIEYGWTKDRAAVDSFIKGLASYIRERNDYEEEDAKEKQAVPIIQPNVIWLLAELNVQIKKAEVVDTILPLFIECLEEGDASTPGLLRLRLLDAVSRIASLGFEKSYREAVVLMIRSYLSKLSSIGSAESKTLPAEANTERVETLPAGFQSIARGLTNAKLRVDFRHRLLSLCSDVGLAAESKSGSSGADFLGPLLPAVAEICSDFDPTVDVEPSLLKLFRNLWFYIALFGLAPPVLKSPVSMKPNSTTLNSGGNTSAVSLQAVGGPYMWNSQWSSAVQRISQGTPPLVVSSVKWLEDELELNALHNPGSRRGSGNERVALSQRTALSASLGGRVEVGAMSTISGVKATYLLAVAFLEIIRFSSNGGILNCGPSSTASRSAFSCVFEYLKSPNLTPAVSQCLMAIVHRAFESALSWLEARICETGDAAEARESTLTVHACFFIKSLSAREDHIRDLSVNLLSQLRDRFPQILWKSSCLDSLLFSVNNNPPSALVNDPALITSVRSLYQKVVREWIIVSLSYAPCTSQGLLQEQLCKANTWQKAQPTTDVVSLLSEIRIGTGKIDCWTGTKTANIPAVMASAAAASGGNLKLLESFNIEVLSTAIVSATVKCNHAGEIAGMTRLYENMESADDDSEVATSAPGPAGLSRLISGSFPQAPRPKKQSFSEILLNKFVRLLQKFVSAAEKGANVDKSSFRETCSQATALLLSHLASDKKPSAESFSQLLRLLCWCPAYISTPDAMETGVFIWTWLVSAAPQLGSVVLAELVDAWLWTIDTKRGLFASEVRFFGPAAKLRPQLAPGEPEVPPEKDPVQEILAHRLWLGFFIDRFEVVRHNSVEQLLLLGRMLQGTTKFPWRFSRHPAAIGTFFTVMLLGLKLCSCQYQGNLHKFKLGLQLLEDRIYRASLGWFCHQPEWYETNNGNFAQSEAQSVHAFVHFLLNQRMDVSQNDSKGHGQENGNSLLNLKDSYHPVWGSMENDTISREKRKQLLLMLCQHEAERLDVWAQPLGSKDSTSSRLKINSEKWTEFARTAFAVDPRIAFSLGARFPTNLSLKSELIQLVQSHILEIRTIPEALPYFVTPKAVDEDSPLLQQLTHWAACSITQALEYFTPAYKGHSRVMAYILRVLESYPPSRVTFFMPQLIQALRYDDELVEGYLIRAAQRSDVFSHILIWHLQGENCAPEQGKEAVSEKTTAFLSLLPLVRQHIIDGFNPKARDIFRREFAFFEKVTSISGVLYPLPKEERRDGIRRELEKIQLDGDDLYLPTAPNKLVKGIQVNSGIPLQSAAKVPIMITFDVADRDGDPNVTKPQACIFKVGDDCRQDVLALQVISLLKDIFEAVGIDLYLFPYGVLPTDPERGIIEVVPNTRSRSQMGETTDGGLYEIFQQDFGAVGSPSFEAARHNFIISSAGYAVASLLLQPKDRHNGNLLIDNAGRLVHIDFGFILETSPGGNMRFESAHFKLSHEMTQLLDPSGAMKSETWFLFVSLCVKGYLAARRYMDGIINTVLMMVESGLPCFSRGDPIGNLRKRFHPEMSEREAANFMIRICADAYDKWSTAGYDLIQYLQQGIEK
uniref:phosphatidylinositol 4-kinase alpha 1-like isoform X2 n=1 Tax=Erigeron canadensis TaxID=72917 RepID=UPI001CB8A859|nr:phosphatidylinositol 4-kinase alpha 1-like isoform X2 [Erigeron canadensis]